MTTIEPTLQRLATCTHCGARTMLFDKEERCMMCSRSMNPPPPNSLPLTYSNFKSHRRPTTTPIFFRKRGRPRRDSYINMAPADARYTLE